MQQRLSQNFQQIVQTERLMYGNPNNKSYDSYRKSTKNSAKGSSSKQSEQQKLM